MNFRQELNHNISMIQEVFSSGIERGCTKRVATSILTFSFSPGVLHQRPIQAVHLPAESLYFTTLCRASQCYSTRVHLYSTTAQLYRCTAAPRPAHDNGLVITKILEDLASRSSSPQKLPLCINEGWLLMLKAWDDICVVDVETWSLSFPQVCRKYPCIGGWGGFRWYQPGSNVASIINSLSCERCGSCVWHEGRELRWPGWPRQWHHPGPRHQSGCWYFLDRIPILYHPSKSKKISEPSVMSYSTFVFADCSIGTPL